MNIDEDYLREIEQIAESFPKMLHFTPLDLSTTFSQKTENIVYLKLENFQKTGSFKIRGAYNKLSRLSEKERNKGVITASAGNHGQAVAYAATLFNCKSTVVVPEGAPIVKIEAIRNYNSKGTVLEHGRTYDDAYQKAREIEKEKDLIFVHAYNDIDIIKGQATLGYELMKQLPDIDYIFCPIGGGGLISGVATYCKTLNPKVKIIGVQSDAVPSMYQSLQSGEIVKAKSKDTICDGIAVKQPGDITFPLIKQYVDEIVLVSDDEVAKAILLLLERSKTFVEGAGATSLAALFFNKLEIKGKKVCAILSGGNLTPNLMSLIIGKGLIKAGRLVKLETTIPDAPGELVKLLTIIAENKANIVSIIHDRLNLDIGYKTTEVILELETRNQEHIDQIVKELSQLYDIKVIEF